MYACVSILGLRDGIARYLSFASAGTLALVVAAAATSSPTGAVQVSPALASMVAHDAACSRAVERGARLVACVPRGAEVVLQVGAALGVLFRSMKCLLYTHAPPVYHRMQCLCALGIARSKVCCGAFVGRATCTPARDADFTAAWCQCAVSVGSVFASLCRGPITRVRPDRPCACALCCLFHRCPVAISRLWRLGL